MSVIAIGMLETNKISVAEALAKIEPRARPISKKRTIIEANRDAIYVAKDRGCTWAQIAEALTKAGFVVTADALRFTINATPRDFKKYPRMMIAKRKPRQQSQQSSIKGREEERIEKKNPNANVDIALNTLTEKSATEPNDTLLPERPPKTATASRFHKMPERL